MYLIIYVGDPVDEVEPRASEEILSGRENSQDSYQQQQTSQFRPCFRISVGI